MIEHSPAPWSVHDFGDGNTLSVVAGDPDKTVICDLPGAFSGEDDQEPVMHVWANAALISAAPELLSALRAFVDANPDEYRTLDKGIGTATVEGRRWLAARDAIAKATGA